VSRERRRSFIYCSLESRREDRSGEGREEGREEVVEGMEVPFVEEEERGRVEGFRWSSESLSTISESWMSVRN